MIDARSSHANAIANLHSSSSSHEGRLVEAESRLRSFEKDQGETNSGVAEKLASASGAMGAKLEALQGEVSEANAQAARALEACAIAKADRESLATELASTIRSQRTHCLLSLFFPALPP